MRGDAITLAFVSEVLKDLATKAALYNPTCSPQNSQEDEEIGVEKYIMRVVEDVKEVKRKFPSALTQEKYDFMERMVISDLAVLADAWEYTLRLKFNWASQ